jgi:hypothetical protein
MKECDGDETADDPLPDCIRIDGFDEDNVGPDATNDDLGASPCLLFLVFLVLLAPQTVLFVLVC